MRRGGPEKPGYHAGSRVTLFEKLRGMITAVPGALLLLAATAGPAGAQHLTIDMMTGTAYNVPTPLRISQQGFPDINLTAHYETKPFGPYAPYFSWRVAWWSGNQAWEVQQVHHRLFLSNTTPDVTAFAVHYGYNYLLVAHAWRTSAFVLHVGAGVVIPNPSNTVRGLTLNTPNPGALDVGARVRGWGGEVAVSRELRLVNHVYALADGAVLFGRAKVPVVDGSAQVPNVGLHGHVGIGISF